MKVIKYKYEIAVLFRQDTEKDFDKVSKKVEKIFTEAEAKITKTDNWGRRKLAYPIAGDTSAVYVFYMLELSPEALSQIERDLNIVDEAIRFLVVRVDEKAKSKAEAAMTELAKKQAERQNTDRDDKLEEKEDK